MLPYQTRSLQGNLRICQGNLREFSGKKIGPACGKPVFADQYLD